MKKYFLILLLVSLVGCATFSPSTTYTGNPLLTKKNITKVKKGMTKQEILDIFGQPYNQIQSSSLDETWMYVLTESHFNGSSFTLKSTSLSITFNKNGKVSFFTKTINRPILGSTTIQTEN